MVISFYLLFDVMTVLQVGSWRRCVRCCWVLTAEWNNENKSLQWLIFVDLTLQIWDYIDIFISYKKPWTNLDDKSRIHNDSSRNWWRSGWCANCFISGFTCLHFVVINSCSRTTSCSCCGNPIGKFRNYCRILGWTKSSGIYFIKLLVLMINWLISFRWFILPFLFFNNVTSKLGIFINFKANKINRKRKIITYQKWL